MGKIHACKLVKNWNELPQWTCVKNQTRLFTEKTHTPRIWNKDFVFVWNKFKSCGIKMPSSWAVWPRWNHKYSTTQPKYSPIHRYQTQSIHFQQNVINTIVQIYRSKIMNSFKENNHRYQLYRIVSSIYIYIHIFTK